MCDPRVYWGDDYAVSTLSRLTGVDILVVARSTGPNGAVDVCRGRLTGTTTGAPPAGALCCVSTAPTIGRWCVVSTRPSPASPWRPRRSSNLCGRLWRACAALCAQGLCRGGQRCHHLGGGTGGATH
ncbi:hypothetical protein pclt_cds_377 [Pandoravirus celtis]|uniref:Uncharacterized protein n=1 Tax=Pandoravirus celtis TaxID=2568002 RepID=A0A4D6EGQ6_9VIRU|nr:hypothetical protein pclt_cds_377 [Pandoravirus celtis]